WPFGESVSCFAPMKKWLSLLFVSACNQVPINNTSNPTANFIEVSPGVYRGARPDQAGLQKLSDMGVHTVLDLENDEGAVQNEQSMAQSLGMTFVSHPMSGLSAPDEATV